MARDVRDSTSRGSRSRTPRAACLTEPKTPVRTPRPPSDHREKEDEWMEDKKEIAERGWWQSYAKGSSSDLAAMNARSMGPTKLTLSGMPVTIS